MQLCIYCIVGLFKPNKARKTGNAIDCATSSLLYYLLLYSVVLWILLQTNCCRLYFNMVSNTWLSLRKIRKIIKLYETVFFTGCLQVPSGRLSCYRKQGIIVREDVHSVRPKWIQCFDSDNASDLTSFVRQQQNFNSYALNSEHSSLQCS